MAATVLYPDHLDLLVTAALRWGLVVDPVRVAFTSSSQPAAVVRSPSAVGMELGELLTGSGDAATAENGESVTGYRWVSVPDVVALEVLKSAMGYRAQAERCSGWRHSQMRGLIDALIVTAAQRLPGYDDIPSPWHRPVVRTAPPIGLRRQWSPVDGGMVAWVSVPELVTRWQDASMVLLTVDALPDLPRDLPPRDRVFVVTGQTLTEQEWVEVAAAPAQLLVQLPTGWAWLRDELSAAVRAQR